MVLDQAAKYEDTLSELMAVEAARGRSAALAQAALKFGSARDEAVLLQRFGESLVPAFAENCEIELRDPDRPLEVIRRASFDSRKPADRFARMPLKLRDRSYGALLLGWSSERGPELPEFRGLLEFFLEILDQRLRLRASREEIEKRDQLIALASHEIKNPLTAMQLRSQMALGLAQKSGSGHPIPELLEKTVKDTKYLAHLVEQLFEFSILEVGHWSLELAEVSVEDLVRDSLERVGEQRRGVLPQIQLELEPGLTGKWDRVKIGQVLVNLISNAIKYGEGKPVIVRSHKMGSGVKISVQDFGLGIPESMREKIFDRFERADAPSSIKGLGLGLYLVYQLVRAHSGRISLESEVGKGSTFTIEFPF